MKYIKTYEKLNEPKVGDYVICSSLAFNIPRKYKNTVKNKIGKITKVVKSSLGLEKMYLVSYGKFQNYFPKFNIIHFAENKSDLEAIKMAKKFNL